MVSFDISYADRIRRRLRNTLLKEIAEMRSRNIPDADIEATLLSPANIGEMFRPINLDVVAMYRGMVTKILAKPRDAVTVPVSDGLFG